MEIYRTDERFNELKSKCERFIARSINDNKFVYSEFDRRMNEQILNRLDELYENFEGELDHNEIRGYALYFIEMVKRALRRGADLSKKYLISTDPTTNSYWSKYEEKLKDQGFNSDSIENIRVNARNILEQGRDNNYESRDVVKGLVIGFVQSGKTANYAGLISLAADHGYHLVIVLAGVMTNLRDQTYDRLTRELDIEVLEPRTLNYNSHTRSVIGGNAMKVAVVLKNSSRLIHLKEWLDFQVSTSNGDLKVLIIDDECDQAGINVRNDQVDDRGEQERTSVHAAILDIIHHDPSTYFKRTGTKKPNLRFRENRTRILQTTYVGYTATPYASVLSEGPGPEDNRNLNLFPKDFIYALKAPNVYWSPQVLFGNSYDTNFFHPAISTFEDDQLDEWLEGGAIPDTLKDAIHWFICCVAVMRFWGNVTPISMLINASRYIEKNNQIGRRIQQYFEDGIDLLSVANTYERYNISKNDFVDHWPTYGSQDTIKSLPGWHDIEQRVESISTSNDHGHFIIDKQDNANHFREKTGLYFAIDSSRPIPVWDQDEEPIVRLNYPTKRQLSNCSQCQGFLVVGGNTLSRGLTIEGLVSSWFARTTSTVDNLMQMGRWFGYRVGYELLPRLWLNSQTADNFKHSSITEFNLHEDIRMNEDIGSSSIDISVQIRMSHTADLRPTARRRMLGALRRPTFSAKGPQTLKLFIGESHIIHNWNTLNQFLSLLPSPSETPQPNKLLWKNVPWPDVRDQFLSRVSLPSNNSRFSLSAETLQSLIEWLTNLPIDIIWPFREQWSVCVIGTHNGTRVSLADNNYSIGAVTRRRQVPANSNGEEIEDLLDPRYVAPENRTYQFKSIRSPADLLADGPVNLPQYYKDEYDGAIINQSSASALRSQQLFNNSPAAPLLLIYPLERNVATPAVEPNPNANYKLLGYELPGHMIALSIVLPELTGEAIANGYMVGH